VVNLDPDSVVGGSSEQTPENAFLLGFERRNAKLFSDLGNNLLLGNIGAFDYNLIPDHNRRGARQIKFHVLLSLVFRARLGYGFNFDGIFCAQPGRHLVEMSSRLSARLIDEETDFQHDSSSLSLLILMNLSSMTA